MASPFANWTEAHFNDESRVNALWNRILTSIFQSTEANAGSFLVKVESNSQQPSSGRARADFSVRRLVRASNNAWATSVPILVVGCRGGHNDREDWDTMEDQLHSWCRTLARRHNTAFDSWALAAFGSECRFYRLREDRWLDVSWDGTRMVSGGEVYDITHNDDYSSVARALRWIKSQTA